MKKMTLKRFYEMFAPDYRSEFEISGHFGDGYMASMDISPYNGTNRFTLSFYKYKEDKNTPQRSCNVLVFRSKDYEEVKKFYEQHRGY